MLARETIQTLEELFKCMYEGKQIPDEDFERLGLNPAHIYNRGTVNPKPNPRKRPATWEIERAPRPVIVHTKLVESSTPRPCIPARLKPIFQRRCPCEVLDGDAGMFGPGSGTVGARKTCPCKIRDGDAGMFGPGSGTPGSWMTCKCHSIDGDAGFFR